MTQKGTVQQGRRREAEFEAETSLSPGSAFWGRCRAGYLHGSLCQVGRCGPIFCPRRADSWRIERRGGRANVRCVPSTRSATSDCFSAAAPIRNRAIKSDD